MILVVTSSSQLPQVNHKQLNQPGEANGGRSRWSGRGGRRGRGTRRCSPARRRRRPPPRCGTRATATAHRRRRRRASGGPLAGQPSTSARRGEIGPE
uniref:Uncharacterized protein n=1 Tax=Arundo donax TaxID=35708 RepID=A0A0A9DA06_ARUDO